MALFTPNIGSAFINYERDCAPIQNQLNDPTIKFTKAQRTAQIAQHNRCISQRSEQKQAARRTLLLIGGVAAVGAYFMFFRKK